MGTDIHGVWQARKDGKWQDVPSTYDQERHYFLFAWLGNVRNGFGFAGIPTHEPIQPLTDRRGYPPDFDVEDDMHAIASIDIMAPCRRKWHQEGEALEIDMGDHSHSWATADEIINGKRPGVVRKAGIITLAQFRAWDGKSQPEEWCGGTSGPGVLVSTPATIDGSTSHVAIEWERDSSDDIRYFIDEAQRLKDIHGEVRFVFGFDS